MGVAFTEQLTREDTEVHWAQQPGSEPVRDPPRSVVPGRVALESGQVEVSHCRFAAVPAGIRMRPWPGRTRRRPGPDLVPPELA